MPEENALDGVAADLMAEVIERADQPRVAPGRILRRHLDDELLQKALIQAWEEAPISRAIAAGVDAFEDAWTTDEPANAMARFLAERRAAKGDA